jgi:hypothetical protein
MKLSAPIFCTCEFPKVISTWYIGTSISMKWPYLALTTNLDLKSTLYDINIATPDWFLGSLAW